MNRSALWVLAVASCGRIDFAVQADARSSDATDAAQDDAACIDNAPVYVAPAPPPGAFWVAPDGSDAASGSSRAEAWATFAHAFSQMAAADTLVLADGTYTTPLVVAMSGITVRAETDGGAIIDGGGVARPCVIDDGTAAAVTGVVLEGLQCRNGTDVVYVNDTQGVTLRRVSAYTAGAGSKLFRIEASPDVVIEDCAATGTGSHGFFVNLSDRARLTRNWVKWVSTTDTYGYAFVIEATSDAVVEDNVAVIGAAGDLNTTGFQLAANGTGVRADRNRFIGNVVRGGAGWGVIVTSTQSLISSNRVVDAVVIGGGGGMFQRGDGDLICDRMTLVSDGFAGWTANATSTMPKDADYALSAVVRDSIIANGPKGFDVTASAYQGAFTNTNNNLFALAQPYVGIAAAGTGEVSVEPAFDTATFGDGAYLRGPGAFASDTASNPVGARILFRSQAGTLTAEPLWPWPMEERIRRETAQSVTWESDGGLWRTLCGVY